MPEETTPDAEREAALAELGGIRQSIDNIDAALVHLLAERFKFTQQVGRLKAAHELPAADPEREKRQITRLRALAVDANLDPAFAEKWFNFVVAEVIHHHERFASDRRRTTDAGRRHLVSWDPRSIPSQSGRTFVVTGANTGVGFFTAAQLAVAGASVVLACRNDERADAAATGHPHPGTALDRRHPAPRRLRPLLGGGGRRRHLGAAATRRPHRQRRHRASAPRSRGQPRRQRTRLRHQLPGPLRPREPPAARSRPHAGSTGRAARLARGQAHPIGARRPAARRRYDSWTAYAQSKLEVESFGFELDRRLRAAGSTTQALVVQPGYSVGGLSPRVPGVNEPNRAKRFGDALQGLWAQGKDRVRGPWCARRPIPLRRAAGTSGRACSPRVRRCAGGPSRPRRIRRSVRGCGSGPRRSSPHDAAEPDHTDLTQRPHSSWRW